MTGLYYSFCISVFCFFQKYISLLIYSAAPSLQVHDLLTKRMNPPHCIRNT